MVTFILLLVYLEWTVAIPIIIGLIWSYALLSLFYKMFVQKKSFLEILAASSGNGKRKGKNSTSSMPPLTGAGEDYASHSSSSDSGGE